MKEKQDAPASVVEYINTPFWDDTLPIRERLDYLIGELTLEEKIQCLTIKAPEVKRLGIKTFLLGGEAAHGVEARHDQEFNRGEPVKTTVFTQPVGMSSTWDTELIEKAGEVVGTEARAVFAKEGNMGLSRWAPTVDMERDPRWGRTEEGYGEDPYLTGKMSSAYIKGIQGRDDFYLRCGATLKHFYANNEETDRECSSSSIDSRNKYEYYLEPFRRAITEGKADSVMTSYNEINGIPAIVNTEVAELLKEQWGLKGHVVCDMTDMGQTVTEHHYASSDAETLAAALTAGIDVFNDPEETVIAAAHEALKEGLIREEDINRSVRNTFSTKLRLGLYDANDRCPYSKITSDALNCPEHKKVCLEMARKSVVLLKNQNRLLPLQNTTGETIAIVGPLADVWNKDWYSGLPQKAVTPLEGLRSEFKDAKLLYTDGMDRIKIRAGERYLAVSEDGTTYFTDEMNADLFVHTDWGDNKHTLYAERVKKYLFADTDNKFVAANKEEVFSWFVQEVFSLTPVKKRENYKDSDNKPEFVIRMPVRADRDKNEACNGTLKYERYMPTGEAKEERKFLEYKLKSWNQMTVCVDERGKLLIADEESLAAVFSFETVADGCDHAVELAAKADKVIAVMGCHPLINCKEGVDRINLQLPELQHKLLEAMNMVNPNMILVLITNYPYAINWEQENLPAILTTASGSQELGTAIAQAVAGEFSPAGRLNMTWYPGEGQLPPMRDYDIIQGKRTYLYYEGNVLYPFGFGLSYTEFHYSDLRILKEDSQLTIKLKVMNTGTCQSDEVVQMYITQLYSRTRRPIRQLKGFSRVNIRAGEQKEIQFLLPYEELKYYDVVSDGMLLEDSTYLIQIGTSSQDIRLQEKVHIEGTVIPGRNMAKPILCDHYDSYSNLCLHRGHDGIPCILPWEGRGDPTILKGSAIYHDSCFDFVPEKFVIDLKAEEQGAIRVYFGALKIVSYEVEAMEAFEILEIPIDAGKIMPGERKPLRIEIFGKTRVVKFWFKK